MGMVEGASHTPREDGDTARMFSKKKEGSSERRKSLTGNHVLALAGFFLVLLSIALEKQYERPTPSASQPAASSSVTSGERLVADTQAHSGFFSLKTASSLTKEIGFALLIAWAISAFIERQSRERDEQNAEATRERIARDVVHAVFGLQHDATFVRTVIEKSLHSKVVRKRFQATYTLEPLNAAEEEQLGVTPSRFVKLTQIS